MLSSKRNKGKAFRAVIPVSLLPPPPHPHIQPYLINEIIKFLLLNRNQVPDAITELARAVDKFKESQQQQRASQAAAGSARRRPARREPSAVKRVRRVRERRVCVCTHAVYY